MRAHVLLTLGTIVTLGRGPWTPTITTTDRLQTLALGRRLDQYR
jgi:hypothetical protein